MPRHEQTPHHHAISPDGHRGGYRELLGIAGPLILSTAAVSFQMFLDRMFLSWYSPESIAAAVPAGILNFALLSVFIGTAGYTSTFVAQYFGAGRLERIGPVVWQGCYVAVVGGAVMAMLAPAAPAFFALVGHAPAVQRLEVRYFRIVCYGAAFPVVSAALSGFFSGRGQVWPVMWINVAATAVNVTLNYLLIFGKAGFPEMGMAGAALATVIGSAVGMTMFAALFLAGGNARRYATRIGRRLDWSLFWRLMRFGFPMGVQFMADMAGFTIFIMLIGRLGSVQLAASNITMNINSLAFMPMLG